MFDDERSLVSGHREILRRASEVFAGMFRCGMREEETGDIRICRITRTSFRGFLEWIYTGVAHILA